MASFLTHNLSRLRKERLDFNVEMDERRVASHLADVQLVFPGWGLQSGDRLLGCFTLNIEYWDEIHRKLEALTRIMADPDVVTKITTEELNHGYCVVEQLFNQLKTLKARLQVC